MERTQSATSVRRPRILVGLESVSGDGTYPKDALACVGTYLIEYPMELESGTEYGPGATVTLVSSDAELRQWAEAEFDHHEIRAL